MPRRHAACREHIGRLFTLGLLVLCPRLHLDARVMRLEVVRDKGHPQPRVSGCEERRMKRLEPQFGQMRDMALSI
jgi:hypothetical protein